MFETSAIRFSRQRRRTRLLYMPLSVALHAAGILGLVFGTVWAVEFPAAPPAEMRGYTLTTVPPMPPPAPPPAGSGSAQPAVRTSTAVHVDLAPQAIPSDIPVLEAQPGEQGSRGGVDGGIPGGDPDGIIGGVDPELVTEPQPAADEAVHPVRGEVRPPAAIYQPPPAYPQLAVNARIEGSVVLACVIDRSGAVREVTVVRADHPILAPAAVEAVKRWRFRAGTLYGNPVNTLYELTVSFQLR
jgi:periplasmic protein TonB